MPTTEDVYTQLKQVFDPEIPVNIVDLGLVYDVAIEGETCKVTMTLTSQSCPEAQTIPDLVRRREDLLRLMAPPSRAASIPRRNVIR